jgi:hypothetical protein
MRGPTQHRTEVFTNFNVAVAGGMDVPIQVSDRIAISPRFRFRTVLPLSSYRPYTRFAISPGVGVQVRF